MRIPYAFRLTFTGSFEITENEAEIIQMIFDYYLAGASLGKVVDMAQRRCSESPNSSLLPVLDELSDVGKQKVADYAHDLAKIPEYQREQPETAPQSPSAPPEGK